MKTEKMHANRLDSAQMHISSLLLIFLFNRSQMFNWMYNFILYITLNSLSECACV